MDGGRIKARVVEIFLGLIVPAGLLAAWSIADRTGTLPEQILPPPRVVLQALRDGFADGSLVTGTLVSLRRVMAGFALGAAAGLAFGLATGRSRRLGEYLNPVFLALSQVPTLGWLPILILLAGIGETPKLIMIGWAAFIPVALNTAEGVRDVPAAYLELGRVLSFGRWSVLGTIVLPSAMPSIFTGLREGLANGWQTLVAVELIASFEGLGYLMAYGRQLFQLELVLSAMLIIGAIGLAFHGLLSLIERRLQRWHPETAQ